MRRALPFLAAGALLGACGDDNNTTRTTSSSGSSSGVGGDTSSSTSSGMSTSTSTSSGQSSSGGGSAPCKPGEQVSCYSGPFGTDGVGDCKAGMKTCAADGTSFGPCVGEVIPAAETCATSGDEDCDGSANEEGAACVCIPGAVKLCYSGGAGTAGVGVCTEGVSTCAADGLTFGPCMGEVTPQSEDCSTPTDEDCDGQTPLCAAMWAGLYGDTTGGQFVWGVGVDAATGDSVITGDFEGTIDFGGGATYTSLGLYDIFLARFDPAGALLWSKTFGDVALQSAQAVAVGPMGEVVITGFFQGTVNFGGGALTTAGGADIFVAKFDASGAHVWSKKFGSATDDQYGLAVAIDPLGDVVVTGSYKGAINFGGANLTSGGGADIYLLKLAGATGNHLFSQRFGDAAIDQAGRAVATDAMGNILLTGKFEGTVNFGGAALASAGSADAFLAKFDTAGVHIFSARFGDAAYQIGRGVGADAAGNIVVVGDFAGAVDLGGGAATSAGNTDVFAGLFDPTGAHLTTTSFGGVGYDSVSAIAVSGGDIALTGYLEGDASVGGVSLVGSGGRDALLAKLSAADLTAKWARLFGDASYYQSGQAVGMDAMGNVFIGGYYFGSADFGLGPLTSAGGADAFIAKLPP